MTEFNIHHHIFLIHVCLGVFLGDTEAFFDVPHYYSLLYIYIYILNNILLSKKKKN